MRVSRSTGYALLAVGYVAKNKSQKIILSQTISEHYDIPLEYLLKILQQLVKANVLRSKRGPRGGFSLARPAKNISMLQVIEAVEGPMTGYLNLDDAQVKGQKIAVKAEKAYIRAIGQAKAVFEKTKIAALIQG